MKASKAQEKAHVKYVLAVVKAFEAQYRAEVLKGKAEIAKQRWEAANDDGR